MSLQASVLMCHAPIVIPAVAGTRAAACTATTDAMTRAAVALLRSRPDLVVVVSPHTPRFRDAVGVCHAACLRGSFARFGAPEVAIDLPGAPELSARFTRWAQSRGVPSAPLADGELDHGAAVPLHFLCSGGWTGKTLLCALPPPFLGGETDFGRALTEFFDRENVAYALLASGDMSHRLTRSAPAGYHPQAHAFDDHVIEHLRAGDLPGAIAVDPGLREIAAEDIIQSLQVAQGAAGSDAPPPRLLQYEAPFGVGYAEAVLYERAASAPSLLKVARDAIAAHLRSDDYEPPRSGSSESRGVFVTLRSADKSLRGCVGHIEPHHKHLQDEVATCARAAATRDPRFPPLRTEELDDVRLEISVLSAPEKVGGIADLDPELYGVVVHAEGKRGVLLPNVDGVTTAKLQVDIARRKAGIRENTTCELFRFRVEKLKE